MTIIVTKPELNIRDELSRLDKPSGIAGEALLRAETVRTQQELLGVGRRNLLINGDMKISQRGNYTSLTSALAGGYYLDRWKTYQSNVNIQVIHNLNQTLPDGSKSNTLKYVTTGSASTCYFGCQQILETALVPGRTYTMSAWVRSNNPNMNLFANAGDYRAFSSGSGEWEYLSVTFISTTGNSFGFINYVGSNGTAASTGDYVEFTQIQLELGSVATPFEYRSYGEELALCQRYYQRWSGFDTAVMARYSANIGTANMMLQYWVPMRITPTCGHGGTFRTTPGFVAPGTISGFGAHIRVVSSVSDVGVNEIRYLESSPDGYIYANAEL